MGKRTFGGFLVAVTLSLVAAGAEAQTSSDRALAETLYQDGRRLMDEKRFPEACEKLAESQRLDPATGTLLNLGACRESEGKLATAWAIFTEAEDAAKRDGRDDRVAFARERIDALAPRLSKLTIEVPDGARVEGLVVKLDGSEVGKAAWGVAAPVDGGTHVIEAAAPGRRPWRGEVEVQPEGDQQRITLEVLTEEATTHEPAAGPVVVAPATAPTEDTPTRRPLGAGVYVAGGLTLVLGGVALGTGVSALSKADDFDAANSNPDETIARREALRDDAQRAQLLNTLFTGAFVGGAVVTTVLVLVRPEKPVKSAGVHVAPWAGPGGGGVLVGGRL